MYIVFLRFADNKSRAAEHMDGHKAWIQKGFDDGVFMMVGSLQPNQGGTVLAHNTSLEDLNARVQNDPFVSESVVWAEVMEISPARTNEHLKFLMP